MSFELIASWVLSWALGYWAHWKKTRRKNG